MGGPQLPGFNSSNVRYVDATPSPTPVTFTSGASVAVDGMGPLMVIMLAGVVVVL